MLYTAKLAFADVISFLKASLMLLACLHCASLLPVAPPVSKPWLLRSDLFVLHASHHPGMSVGVGGSRSSLSGRMLCRRGVYSKSSPVVLRAGP